jgi:hypothetical protein
MPLFMYLAVIGFYGCCQTREWINWTEFNYSLDIEAGHIEYFYVPIFSNSCIYI